jgi:serine acetyltransferase
VIGDGAILLPNCAVLGPLTVGRDAVVSANAFVDRDVPAGGVAYTRRAELAGPPEGGETAAERAVRGERIGATKLPENGV